LTNLAAIYTLNERTAEAEQTFAEADAAILPDALEQRASMLRERGCLYLAMNRPAEAERDLRAALDMRRRNAGSKNGFTWYFYSQWGRGLAAQGRLAEAEATQREARRQIAALLGPKAYQNSLIADDLADTLKLEPGTHAEVIALRRESLALTEAKLPRTHPLWAQRALNLAAALASGTPTTPRAPDAGLEADAKEAAALLDPAIAVDRTTTLQARELAHALALRGKLRLARGDRAGARTDLTEALARLGQLRIPDAASTAAVQRDLKTLADGDAAHA
jgi:hypothetical protein